jgi:antitoxin component of MazEF toxin-antitoxin module
VESQTYYRRTVRRVGFSLTVTLPAPLLRALNIKLRDEVDIYMVGEVLCMQRVDRGGFARRVVPVLARAQGDTDLRE